MKTRYTHEQKSLNCSDSSHRKFETAVSCRDCCDSHDKKGHPLIKMTNYCALVPHKMVGEKILGFWRLVMKNQRFGILYLGATMMVAGYSTPASAIGVCDFLSGDAQSICRAAKRAVKERKKKPAPQSDQAVAPSSTAQPSQKPDTQRAVAAVQNNPDFYEAKQFYGIDVWANAFDKAHNNPAEFKTFIAGMIQSATGAGATANALVTGPQRNFYQKFLTDYQIYNDYFSSRSTLLDKSRECTVPRKYTPAEACDCVAGFPGSTLIGPGAGELVTGSNSNIGINACGKAAAAATDPNLKARYTAQRARAQVYTYNTFQAVEWADEAIRMGYPRASIVKASAALRDFEIRNSGFPAPSRQESEVILKIGSDFLKEAKRLGVQESYIIARQYQQALAIYKFNTSLYMGLYKSMTTPPPAEKSGGCRADGVPCSGEKYDSSGNIVRKY